LILLGERSKGTYLGAQITKHLKTLSSIKLSSDDTLRDRVLAEIMRKRVKTPNEKLGPGDSEYEKYLKLSNQMNTNELHDVFMGRM
jgi:glycine cleavage system pyridoxal-binding protein P